MSLAVAGGLAFTGGGGLTILSYALKRAIGNATFARADSGATVIDYEGALRYVDNSAGAAPGDDVPRFRGARIDRNCVTESRAIPATTSGDWTVFSIGIALTANVLAPDGTNTALRISESSGGTVVFVKQTKPELIGHRVRASIWARIVSGSHTISMYQGKDTATGIGIITTEWQRLATLAAEIADTGEVGFLVSGMSPGEIIEVWQPQAEIVGGRTIGVDLPSEYTEDVSVFSTEHSITAPAGIIDESAVGDPIAAATLEGCMVERASTNMVAYSRDFQDAYWTKGVDLKWSAPSVATIDGRDTCTQVVVATGGLAADRALFKQLTSQPSDDYTASFWVKRTAGTGNFELAVTGGVFVAKTATSDWARYDVTTASPITAPYAYIRFADNASTFLVDFAQLESGIVATSEIPTTTAAVTRADEELYIPSPPVNDFEIEFTVTYTTTLLNHVLMVSLSDGTHGFYVSKFGANLQFVTLDVTTEVVAGAWAPLAGSTYTIKVKKSSVTGMGIWVDDAPIDTDVLLTADCGALAAQTGVCWDSFNIAHYDAMIVKDITVTETT